MDTKQSRTQRPLKARFVAVNVAIQSRTAVEALIAVDFSTEIFSARAYLRTRK